MGGITIEEHVFGENAVVAAGAVVITDVPAHTMRGGVPAKVLKKLSIQT